MVDSSTGRPENVHKNVPCRPLPLGAELTKGPSSCALKPSQRLCWGHNSHAVLPASNQVWWDTEAACHWETHFLLLVDLGSNTSQQLWRPFLCLHRGLGCFHQPALPLSFTGVRLTLRTEVAPAFRSILPSSSHRHFPWWNPRMFNPIMVSAPRRTYANPWPYPDPCFCLLTSLWTLGLLASCPHTGGRLVPALLVWFLLFRGSVSITVSPLHTNEFRSESMFVSPMCSKSNKA